MDVICERSRCMDTSYSAEELFRQYADTIYRVAISYTNNSPSAQDIVQEVFLRYLKAQPPFESAEHAKAWLIRVAVNCCKSMHSSAWFRKTCPLEDNTGESGEWSASLAGEERELYKTLLELPPKYRVILYLRYYEEYQIKEIAEMLHLSPNLVSVRLKRAKNIMRQKIEGGIDDEEDI